MELGKKKRSTRKTIDKEVQLADFRAEINALTLVYVQAKVLLANDFTNFETLSFCLEALEQRVSEYESFLSEMGMKVVWDEKEDDTGKVYIVNK